ncbi:MAG: phosphoadenylyl-sulfate reductase, partial [Candidatus Sumerlaeaceae bacterium]|nr:phosphoadenylyl-sulfate reductase [Candidatus Sumerlaeaceae bacterium]
NLRFDSPDLARLNEELKQSSPEEILRWAAETFGQGLCCLSSMQKTAGMIMHILSRVAPTTEIIFVDTNAHFDETLELRDEFIKRFGCNIKTYYPAKSFDEQRQDYGRDLYLHDSDTDPPGYRECCVLRKEMPFIEAVRGRFEAVIGGLTRAEGGARKEVNIVTPDPRLGAYRVYPLAYQSKEVIEEYTRLHDLPVHALYAQGYKSIGCFSCTTPVLPGEPDRAGRWRHIRENNPALAGQQIYCGINFEDKSEGNKA